MSYTNPVLIGGGTAAQSVYEVVTSPRHEVGTLGYLQDGRAFEYVRSQSATAIGKGKLVTYDPVAAAVDKLAVGVASAIGSITQSVTVATTSNNQYAGAYLSIDDDAGEAELYRIVSHPLHASETVFTLDRPLVVATTTSTTVTIVQNSNAVKLSAAVTAQAQPVEVAAGVTLVSVGAGDTTSQYFWVQKTGLANVLFGTAVGAVGQPCYHGEDAGSFQVVTMDHADTTDRTEIVNLGTIAALLPVDTEYHVVRLNIA
jgi:hypothetical protein